LGLSPLDLQTQTQTQTQTQFIVIKAQNDRLIDT
jgi:hypothetical protein